MSKAALVDQIARAVLEAEALLITTGAGMGVDSGLGTFRGRNAGVWPPLKALRLDFSEMSCPDWFQADARLAWAFWHFRHQAYTKGTPHAGYGLLSKWGNGLKHGLFSVTSNIDGHWERTAGVGPGRVYECHGAITHLQCTDEHSGRIWPTDDAQIACMQVPQWDLEPGEAVEIEVDDGGWIPAVVGDDGATMLEQPGGKVLTAKGVRRPGGLDLCRVAEGSALPTCASSGKPARPNVLMFGDWSVNMRRINEQSDEFNSWLRSLPKDCRLVIAEVGAGKAVPTIRCTSERTARSFPNSTLVRINLDDSDVPEGLQDRAVSLGGIGALDALLLVDGLLDSFKGV